MSLAVLAIRACTFLSLYNRTLAGDRVLDSVLVPLDEAAEKVPRPFITVAIDETTGKTDSKDLLSATESVSLVIEMAVGTVVAADGPDGTEVRLPSSDPGLEWALDILGYQVVRELTTGAGFADLWRRFVLRIGEVTRVRGGNAKNGPKFSARQIVIDLHPIGDPTFALPLEDGSVWADFLAALRAIDDSDPELVDYRDLADAVEEAITTQGDVMTWEGTAARLGVSHESLAGLGLNPVVTDAGVVTAIATFGELVDEPRAEELLGPSDAE